MKNGYYYLRSHLISLLPWRCSVHCSAITGSQEGDAEFGVLDIYQGSIPMKGRRRKQDGTDEKVNFNAGSIPFGSTLHILMSTYCLSEQPTLGPNYWVFTSLPSSVIGHRLLQLWYAFEQGCSLQLSPTLKEVTAWHQVLPGSGLNTSMSIISAILLNRSSE